MPPGMRNRSRDGGQLQEGMAGALMIGSEGGSSLGMPSPTGRHGVQGRSSTCVSGVIAFTASRRGPTVGMATRRTVEDCVTWCNQGALTCREADFL